MFLGTIIATIIGYLIGSFSFSITIVKLKQKQDIRELGSKNAGATNASRVLGKKWGVIIMILDSLKVVIAAFIAMGINCIDNNLFNQTSYIIPAFAALLGHCFPLYHKFKGGKAVSCYLGLLVITNIIIALIFFVVWWIIIFITNKVSASSLLSSIIAAILLWIPWLSGWHFNGLVNGFDFFAPNYAEGLNFVWFNKFHEWNQGEQQFYDSFITINIVIDLAVIVILFRHKENIKRIFNGTETHFFKTKEERLAKKEAKQKSIDKKENNNKK